MKSNVIFFMIGSVIGAGATFVVTKTVDKKNFEKRINMEVDNKVNAELAKVKEEYKKASQEEPEAEVVNQVSNPAKKPDFYEYVKEVSKKHNYTNYSDSSMDVENGGPDPIRVIASADIPMGIEDDIIRYNYWADGVVSDENNDVLSREEIDEYIGRDFKDYFGKDPEEPDIVYVKNGVGKDERYFEITMSARTFGEYMNGSS